MLPNEQKVFDILSVTATISDVGIIGTLLTVTCPTVLDAQIIATILQESGMFEFVDVYEHPKNQWQVDTNYKPKYKPTTR